MSYYPNAPVKVTYSNAGDLVQGTFYLNAILLKQLDIARQPNTLYFRKNATIDYSGLSVMAVYQDDSHKSVIATISPPQGARFEPDNNGQMTVNLAYQEAQDKVTTSFTIYELAVTSIRIDTQPTTTEYIEGQSISYDGLVVTAVYTDQREEDVTEVCTFSVAEGKSFDPSTDTSVEITYKENIEDEGHSCYLTLTEKILTPGAHSCYLRVEAEDGQELKTDYILGESIDYSNAKVIMYFGDGTDTEFDVTSQCDFDPQNGTAITETVEAEITCAPMLNPDVYDYNIGYIQNGVWTYENPTQTYTDIYRVTGGRVYSLKLGNVVGSRFRAMFTTTDIRSVNSGTVRGSVVVNINNPNTYAEANNFTAPSNGYILVAKDNVGVSGLHTYLQEQNARSEDKTVSTTLELKCFVLQSISATPNILYYRVREIMTYDNVVVTAHYSDGQSGEITKNVTADAVYSPPYATLMSRSRDEVNISYTENETTKTTSIPIGIPELTALEVTSPPTVTTFIVNDTLDLTGCVITAIYAYEDTRIGTQIVTDNCIFTPVAGTTLSTLGDQTVTVQYTDNVGDRADTSFNIKVVEKIVESLTITPPTKTEYRLGDNLDLTDCVVIANYSDNTTADVTASCVFTPADGTTLTDRDISIVTVSYTENNITVTGNFAINVITLDFLTTEAGAGAKTAYRIGEYLDYTGFVFTAHYSNGDTKVVTPVITPPSGTMVTGKLDIIATYTEGTEIVQTNLTSNNNYGYRLLNKFTRPFTETDQRMISQSHNLYYVYHGEEIEPMVDTPEVSMMFLGDWNIRYSINESETTNTTEDENLIITTVTRDFAGNYLIKKRVCDFTDRNKQTDLLPVGRYHAVYDTKSEYLLPTSEPPTLEENYGYPWSPSNSEVWGSMRSMSPDLHIIDPETGDDIDLTVTWIPPLTGDYVWRRSYQKKYPYSFIFELIYPVYLMYRIQGLYYYNNELFLYLRSRYDLYTWEDTIWNSEGTMYPGGTYCNSGQYNSFPAAYTWKIAEGLIPAEILVKYSNWATQPQNGHDYAQIRIKHHQIETYDENYGYRNEFIFDGVYVDFGLSRQIFDKIPDLVNTSISSVHAYYDSTIYSKDNNEALNVIAVKTEDTPVIDPYKTERQIHSDVHPSLPYKDYEVDPKIMESYPLYTFYVIKTWRYGAVINIDTSEN